MDRYTFHKLIGTGGMASVYIGTRPGAADFLHIVAIKRMHPSFAQNPTFATRFRDEAWLCARLLHPNIVQTLDVVEWKGELLLVMEFVEGVTLDALLTDALAARISVPPNVTLGILVPALHALHHAHETTDDEGHPLGIVHRDFSPQNLMVGRDGNTKILDFGVATARGQLHVTSAGELWGKFGYLAPEQIYKHSVDRRADVFAAGVVLWEMLTGQRLFRELGLSEAGVIERVLYKVVPAPSTVNPAIPPELDAIVLRALQRDLASRYESARAFALALESELPMQLQPASSRAVADFAHGVSQDRLGNLAALRASIRRRSLATDKTIPDPRSASEVSQRQPSAPPQTQESRGWRRWRGRAAVAAIGMVVLSAALLAFASWPPQSKASLASVSSCDAPASSPSASWDNTTTQDGLARLQNTPAMGDSPPPQDRWAELGSFPRSSNSPAAMAPAPQNRKPRLTEKIGASSARKTMGTTRAPHCDPPTYLDMEGVRHFKEGCL